MKRTNEELVQRIQSGQREDIAQLWERVQDFIIYLADRYLLNYPAHCRQLHGDMVNQAYFCFLNAIEGYQPDKGKFTTHLAHYVKNAFQEALRGRTSRTKNEPLNSAVSLDKPIDETEGLTLVDMLIDTQSEAYYRQWIHKLCRADSYEEERRGFYSEKRRGAYEEVRVNFVRYLSVKAMKSYEKTGNNGQNRKNEKCKKRLKFQRYEKQKTHLITRRPQVRILSP